MEDGILVVKPGILIPLSEIRFTASRSGGAGGQHVNKTSTKITVHWNISTTTALDESQKARIILKLSSRLTNEGELVVHSSSSRSQHQNKEEALKILAEIVRKALHVPKKRMKTKVPKEAKEARLKAKSHRSKVKKLRSKKIED